MIGFRKVYWFIGLRNHYCGGNFPHDREIGSSKNSIVYMGKEKDGFTWKVGEDFNLNHIEYLTSTHII